MKRIPFYIILLILTFLAPVRRVDIEHLEPVEAVFAVRKGNQITLATDTGASGTGDDVAQALIDLEETTPGIVFLDTAHYLLLSTDAQEDVNQLRQHLKGSVQLCMFEGEQDPEKAIEHLKVYGKLPQIKDWNPAEPLPVLTEEKIIEK